MANRNWANGKAMYAMHVKPVLVDCNFMVSSTSPGGIINLKGPVVASVTMNQSSLPPGSPALGTARSYAILGASTVSNTGASVVTGNLGLYPGTAVTGFPPGVVVGMENIANAAAQAAQASASSAYTSMQAMTATVIPTALDGQALTPGVYKATSGTFTLAQSGPGTLTLNGAGIYIFQTTSTLTTGAGGTPTILLTGGASASNVYFVVGSSATINSGTAGVFNGNIIAEASITDSLGGTVNGSLIALTGAVTLSAATLSNAQSGGSTMGSGLIVVTLNDNYNRYFSEVDCDVRSPLNTPSASITAGQAYSVQSLGTTTPAQWQAAGFLLNQMTNVINGVGYPQINAAFIAASTQTIPGAPTVASTLWSGIDHIEVVGDPNKTIAPNFQQGIGAQIIMQCYAAGAPAAPVDGSVVSLMFYLSDSSILIQGE
jgi:Ice-binding-like